MCFSVMLIGKWYPLEYLLVNIYIVSGVQSNMIVRYLYPSQSDNPPMYYPSDIVYSCYNTIDYTAYAVLYIMWLHIFLITADI